MKSFKKICLLSLNLLIASTLFACANNEEKIVTTETTSCITSSSSSSYNYVYPSFDSKLEIYASSSVTKGNLCFTSSLTTERYEDVNHNLKYAFIIDVKNSSTTEVDKISISDVVAYGNSEKLEENVCSDVASCTILAQAPFSSKTYNIYPSETAEICFAMMIPEGNIKANITVEASINNTTLTAHLYKESETNTSFEYIHDPDFNSKVGIDATIDSTAIYGYIPSTTGSLSTYAAYNWTDAESVAGYKKSRIEYIESNDAIIKKLEDSLRAEGKTIEEIARACSAQRNQNRLDAYKDDPEGLANCKARNLEKYGNELGPTADSLYEKYGSWETVLEKCYSSNRAMDAICGVYDKYFYMYEN